MMGRKAERELEMAMWGFVQSSWRRRVRAVLQQTGCFIPLVLERWPITVVAFSLFLLLMSCGSSVSEAKSKHT